MRGLGWIEPTDALCRQLGNHGNPQRRRHHLTAAKTAVNDNHVELTCASDRIAANSSGRRVDRTYDARNRLPGWYTWGINYGYDANGSLASHTYPTGLVVNYAPNALGQATQAGTWATGVQYHPNGAVKQFSYGNGLVHTMTQNARQLPLTSADSGGALNQTYYYDSNGNVSHVDDGLDNVRDRWMSYDALDRLTDAGAAMFGGDHWHRFTYDAIDNLRSWKLAGVKDYATYDYDRSNRLTSVLNGGGATIHAFSYDPQGNLSAKNSVGHDFDYGNRLREVPGQEHYRYDGLGRRALAWRPNAGGSTLSIYSQGGQVMYQHAEPLTRTSEHIYLAGSLVATREWNWATATLSTKYQHTDALGSPIAVSNEAGVVPPEWRTNYDPYGGPINKTIDGIGYTGHVMDPLTGLTNMQQRYYDQGVGRFLSVDPVAVEADSGDNFNRYNYAANNPYKFTDPDGRMIHDRGRRPFEELRERFKRPHPWDNFQLNVGGAAASSGRSEEQSESGESQGGVRPLVSCNETKTCIPLSQVKRGDQDLMKLVAVGPAAAATALTIQVTGPAVLNATFRTKAGREIVFAVCQGIGACQGKRPSSQRRNQEALIKEARQGALR